MIGQSRIINHAVGLDILFVFIILQKLNEQIQAYTPCITPCVLVSPCTIRYAHFFLKLPKYKSADTFLLPTCCILKLEIMTQDLYEFLNITVLVSMKNFYTQLLFSMQCPCSKVKTEWQLADVNELLNVLFIMSYSL